MKSMQKTKNDSHLFLLNKVNESFRLTNINDQEKTERKVSSF